jgi:hypothetical protein
MALDAARRDGGAMSTITDTVAEEREHLIAEMAMLVATYGLGRRAIEQAMWSAVHRAVVRTGKRPRTFRCRELLDARDALQAIAQRRAH